MIEPLPNFALIWSKAFSEAARLAALARLMAAVAVALPVRVPSCLWGVPTLAATGVVASSCASGADHDG